MSSFTKFLLAGLAAIPMYAACCKNSVAVVAELSGTATARVSGSNEKSPVYGLDWLAEGTTVEIGKDSKAILILLNGRRWELGEGAKATLSADAALRATGNARELVALPAIPKPAAVALESAPTSGAGRIRGAGAVTNLYPRKNSVALAEKLTLKFAPVATATSYRVTLEDDSGNRILDTTTESTTVPVADGTTEWGSHYSWHVRAFVSSTVIAQGGSEFSTLSAEEALRREEFAKAVGVKSNDPAALALLADVDLRLGLTAEACEEFSAALQKKPDDAALRRALEAAQASLK